jgi:hypothetical protein
MWATITYFSGKGVDLVRSGFPSRHTFPEWRGRLIENRSSFTEGEAIGDRVSTSSHVIPPVMHFIVSALHHLYVGTSIQMRALLLTLYTFDCPTRKIALYFR